MLLFTLFVLVPVVEIYVIVQISHLIGVISTLALLVAVSVIGVWLVKHQGVALWRRMNAQVRSGHIPTNELIDGALVLAAGALIAVPGFVTDAFGVLLLFPPVRWATRAVTRRRFQRRVQVIRATYSGPDAYDVSATDVPPERRRELGK